MHPHGTSVKDRSGFSCANECSPGVCAVRCEHRETQSTARRSLAVTRPFCEVQKSQQHRRAFFFLADSLGGCNGSGFRSKNLGAHNGTPNNSSLASQRKVAKRHGAHTWSLCAKRARKQRPPESLQIPSVAGIRSICTTQPADQNANHNRRPAGSTASTMYISTSPGTSTPNDPPTAKSPYNKPPPARHRPPINRNSPRKQNKQDQHQHHHCCTLSSTHKTSTKVNH